jgi:hypothetical protein
MSIVLLDGVLEYVASYAFGYYAGVRRTARLTATYRW